MVLNLCIDMFLNLELLHEPQRDKVKPDLSSGARMNL